MIIGIDSSRAFVGDKTGTENYSYHVINSMLRLPESGAHTFVLFIRPNAILPKELDGYSNVIIKEVKFPYLWTQLGLAWETWSKINLDVLWVPAHTLPVLRNPRIKTVVTIHGLEYQWLPEYKNWLQKWYLPLSTFYAAKSATQLIAVSEFTKNQLLKELHTSSKNIKVIHEGVEISTQSDVLESSKLMQKFGLREKEYLLFVGTVQPRKNLAALIEAFARLKSDSLEVNGVNKLVIAGGIGWMADEILAAPAKFGVEDKVIFTGRVNDADLRALYLGAMAYVQPSITEGFGLPILEAMFAGIPVISSDGGALPEIVGSAGVVVKLNSGFVDGLARAIQKVVGEPQLRAKIVAKGKKRIMEFTWEKAAKETLKVLIEPSY